jgi:putative endonuclease
MASRVPPPKPGQSQWTFPSSRPKRRLGEHRSGASIHTSQYNITQLVYIESHETAPDAIAREKQIKKWRREKKVALVDSANPEWLGLSSEIH